GSTHVIRNPIDQSSSYDRPINGGFFNNFLREKLCLSIVIDGIWQIIFFIGTILSIKYKVGREMYQMCVVYFTSLYQMGNSFYILGITFVTICLALIHIGHRCTVNNNFRFIFGKNLINLVRISNIHLDVIISCPFLREPTSPSTCSEYVEVAFL